ncbi:NYN domain-containing protein [Alteromonas facilis]|uniref:LabA-like NYN domain-containing protein n=1 Tax=Alteromonas facilis TaxID=2048004 RepID=UPI001F0BE172|nr:NYN domain-containing protein [Alteromonas facilis]
MISSKPTAAIFVDVQNIYYTCKEHYKRSFNYRALMERLDADYDVSIANAYAIDSNNEGQRKFQTALRSMGFNVKLKPYITRGDGSAKGDWDVGITIDIMDAMAQVEHVILMSGDGDFDCLMRRVNQCEVETHVISVEALTALSLINSCDHHIPIVQTMLQ